MNFLRECLINLPLYTKIFSSDEKCRRFFSVYFYSGPAFPASIATGFIFLIYFFSWCPGKKKQQNFQRKKISKNKNNNNTTIKYSERVRILNTHSTVFFCFGKIVDTFPLQGALMSNLAWSSINSSAALEKKLTFS